MTTFASLLCSVILLSWLGLLGCGSRGGPQGTDVGSTPGTSTLETLGAYMLSGNTMPVRDPGMIRQGSTYYVFSTDPATPSAQGYLPVRCSSDTVSWSACGFVFSAMPAWIAAAVPGADNLWAPDISYFGGVYHLYYAASTLLSQSSAIGEATNATLDPSSPQYKWVDQGEVIASGPGDNFNALDPNILVDTGGQVWMTYGSFWSGIKQRSIDASTGKLSAANTSTYSLASRSAALGNAVEGASLVQNGGYYYLFLSTGHCCEANFMNDDYEEIVGRSSRVDGPFVDMAGTDLEAGGGTVLLERDSNWVAPGGGSAYVDATTGESMLAFHAAKISESGAPYLWVKRMSWVSGWPVLQ